MVRARCLLVILLSSVVSASAAPPAGLFPKGQKAVLEYTIEIEGKADGADSHGQCQHWLTRRSLALKATLMASEPASSGS